MSIKMQQRRDTAANWTSTNPTLAQGEIGFETDTKRIKIGDGSTAWNSLPDFTIPTVNSITASGNAATIPVTYKSHKVTNNSAATLTITLTTSGAVDGQATIIRILDFSAVAQNLTFVNTENSDVSVPATSNGSTTLPRTVGFIYNASTGKHRCVLNV